MTETSPYPKGQTRLIVAFLFLVVMAAPLFAHNGNMTFTRIDWNKNDSSIELILEAHSHELETKLSLLAGERLSFLDDADFYKLQATMSGYARQSITINIDGNPVALDYIGMENQNQTIFVYLEANWPKAPGTMEFMNTMLLDDLPGQINSVIAVVNGERRGAEITHGSGPVDFSF